MKGLGIERWGSNVPDALADGEAGRSSRREDRRI